MKSRRQTGANWPTSVTSHTAAAARAGYRPRANNSGPKRECSTIHRMTGVRPYIERKRVPNTIYLNSVMYVCAVHPFGKRFVWWRTVDHNATDIDSRPKAPSPSHPATLSQYMHGPNHYQRP